MLNPNLLDGKSRPMVSIHVDLVLCQAMYRLAPHLSRNATDAYPRIAMEYQLFSDSDHGSNYISTCMYYATTYITGDLQVLQGLLNAVEALDPCDDLDLAVPFSHFSISLEKTCLIRMRELPLWVVRSVFDEPGPINLRVCYQEKPA